MSPRKIRRVADLVRGKKIGEALNLLSFMPQESAKVLGKVIRSAMANAEQKQGIDVDTLFVKTITVNEGPTLKRFRAAPMGRGVRILKRTSHIHVFLDEA
jgi:large subunit ribosomal protein L22